MQISLCMIVKNEQRVLPALLEEVRDFFDEIIVVDNGSTDRTREILSHFDVITIVRENAEEHPYEADLRNAGIALATNPWVLILDADERVSREGLARLRDMEPEAGTDGYFLRWDTYSGGEVIEDYKLALIRSDARFVGAVHANVQPHFRRHHRLARWSNALRIEHRPDPSRLAAKALLRERALRRALKDDPDNVRCLWFLGYGRLGQNRLEDALEYLGSAGASRSTLFPVECLNSMLMRAEALARLGRRDEALREVEAAADFFERVRNDFEVAVNFRLERWLRSAALHYADDTAPLHAYRFPYLY